MKYVGITISIQLATRMAEKKFPTKNPHFRKKESGKIENNLQDVMWLLRIIEREK